MQRVNQKIPGGLGRLAGLLQHSHYALAAHYCWEPPNGKASGNVRGAKREWLKLNLVQKLQRMEHFREGATQNTRIRGFDSSPSHGRMSDRAAFVSQEDTPSSWRPARSWVTWQCVSAMVNPPSHQKRPAFLNPYTPPGSCLYHFRKRSRQW